MQHHRAINITYINIWHITLYNYYIIINYYIYNLISLCHPMWSLATRPRCQWPHPVQAPGASAASARWRLPPERRGSSASVPRPGHWIKHASTCWVFSRNTEENRWKKWGSFGTWIDYWICLGDSIIGGWMRWMPEARDTQNSCGMLWQVALNLWSFPFIWTDSETRNNDKTRYLYIYMDK